MTAAAFAAGTSPAAADPLRWRAGHRALLSNGDLVDLLDPDPAAIDLKVIGLALARVPRFAAQTPAGIYSVAQHCCVVAAFVPESMDPRLRVLALLHDAHEALTGDMVMPVLAALDALHPGTRDAVEHLRAGIDAAIADACGLDWPPPEDARTLIRHCDRQALAVEAAIHMPDAPAGTFPPMPNRTPAAVSDVAARCWGWSWAYQKWRYALRQAATLAALRGPAIDRLLEEDG